MGAVALTKETFHKQIEQGVTLVDFWAPWCGPCKIQLPIVEELSDEMSDQATIAKVNIDNEPELASEYGVMNIPTLLVFKDGKMIDKMVGLQSKEVLKKKLQQ
ncbi:thioredoxin [Paenibacillus alginolyticus]|uniref:thioredoxin n=1 Tax=Paenibacillus alginolyticus TaxID=59839 RepID=UPI00042850D0|nr:thioredoxin [Paenibacillus alginolyticus]MCY9669628.1 thioredoxin [Paenibacillus alginolyticus]